jgi:hypothetical protein
VTTTCGDAEAPCTNQDYCDGGGTCHDNGFKPAVTACGDPSDSACDNPDHCTGVDAGCNPNHEPVTTTCGDAEAPCTKQDYCDGGGLCHDNGFKPATTACGNPADTDCDNPDHCTGVDAACLPNHEAAGLTCTDDGNVCTTDVCTGGGSCSHPSKPAGVPCTSDGNVCTDDQCDGGGVCAHANNTEPCSDGNACTAPDVCGGGACNAGPPVYGFTGFFEPVNNPMTLNVGKAGRTFPLKFKLPLCAGGFVSRPNVVTAITYRAITCDTFLAQDTLPSEAGTSGSSGLHYDATAQQWVFNWQTSNSFVNKCYELRFDFDNGSYRTALFKFSK